jgi:hypothetical protein
MEYLIFKLSSPKALLISARRQTSLQASSVSCNPLYEASLTGLQASQARQISARRPVGLATASQVVIRITKIQAISI